MVKLNMKHRFVRLDQMLINTGMEIYRFSTARDSSGELELGYVCGQCFDRVLSNSGR